MGSVRVRCCSFAYNWIITSAVRVDWVNCQYDVALGNLFDVRFNRFQLIEIYYTTSHRKSITKCKWQFSGSCNRPCGVCVCHKMPVQPPSWQHIKRRQTANHQQEHCDAFINFKSNQFYTIFRRESRLVQLPWLSGGDDSVAEWWFADKTIGETRLPRWWHAILWS